MTVWYCPIFDIICVYDGKYRYWYEDAFKYNISFKWSLKDMKKQLVYIGRI